MLALAAVVFVIVDSGVLELVLIGVAALATLAATKAVFSVHLPLPGAADPARPVLFYNPKSGGGKAERFKLADEARARGIEPIELGPPWDLEQLVRDAIARGADALAMAGGDGSQAIVAAIAAERELPYACIPAGTRNHFALDLGVNRDDVVGALDAFVDGGEKRVDLAEVNGRVFVNNVSLGLYADAVQREGYREAKLRTILGTLPEVLGPEGAGLDLRWTGPGGSEHSAGAAILVSNNRYRLGNAVGSGTRPHIDDGLLGITVIGGPKGRGEDGGGSSGRGVSGRRRSSRSAPRARSRPASTARRWCLRPRSGSRSARACCGCGSPARIPAPHPRRRCRTACSAPCARCSPSPRDARAADGNAVAEGQRDVSRI